MNHPTDPMTPVRALIEAMGLPVPDNIKHIHSLIGRVCEKDPDLTVQELHDSIEGVYNLCGEYQKIMVKLDAATASISQLLSEHDKVVEYIKELRDEGVCMPSNIYKTLPDERRGLLRCADRLQSIVEGK